MGFAFHLRFKGPSRGIGNVYNARRVRLRSLNSNKSHLQLNYCPERCSATDRQAFCDGNATELMKLLQVNRFKWNVPSIPPLVGLSPQAVLLGLSCPLFESAMRWVGGNIAGFTAGMIWTDGFGGRRDAKGCGEEPR